MSEDNKDFEANSIDEILKEFQAKRDNNDLPGERHIDEPLAPPKPHTDFSNENFDYPEKPLKYKHIRRISD